MEYDINPLGIESNIYIIDQRIKNLTKLGQDKDSKVNRLKKEVKQMKKKFK